jgi:hypothetical protein
MKGADVKNRIQLLDADRPGEFFDVDLEEKTATKLVVSVPNTIVKFDLRRREGEDAFSGSLGGRLYVFTEDVKTRKSATNRR